MLKGILYTNFANITGDPASNAALVAYIAAHGGGSVTTDSSLQGDGTGGNPLGINFGNSGNVWTKGQAYKDNLAVNSFDTNLRLGWDSSGLQSYDYGNRLATNSSLVTIIDWQNALINNSVGANVLNFSSVATFAKKVALQTGNTGAGNEPIQFTSGSLLTAPTIGTMEFLTDKYYGTISTGTARKEFTLNDSALTSTRVPFSTTNGRLNDSSALTYSTSILTVGAVGSGQNGNLNLIGTTSGTVHILVQSAAGTYNFNLPTSAGSSGQPLLSGGGVGTAMTFGTLGIAVGGTNNTAMIGGTNGVVYYNGSQLTNTTGGSSNTVLHGNASSAPSFSAIVTADLLGGSTTTTGDLLQASSGSALSKLPNVTAGQLLISTGTTTLLAWSGANAVLSQNLKLGTVGNALFIKEGTGGFQGSATLVAGTIAITITGLTTADRAFVQRTTAAGTIGTGGVTAVCTANTLTITSIQVTLGTQTLDTSTFNYIITRPA